MFFSSKYNIKLRLAIVTILCGELFLSITKKLKTDCAKTQEYVFKICSVQFF